MGDVSGSNCRNTVKNTSAKMIQIPIRLKKFLFNFQAPSPLLITLFSGCKFQTVKDTDNSLSWKCFLSFLTRILGVDAYLSFFEAFADNIDNNIRFFEEKGIPFNIHNILQYIKDESDVKVKDIVSVISFVLFILSMIIYALVVLYVVAIKKQWIDTDNKSIVYGDNV